ncbi:unnamed protein product [Macrosiphum euphorbiae]|uniref:Uncharacterized protein n=1 Tax=Macrosiphum euphorbiae TaxID=13131 RepID=A0AAV0XVL9_9HEMI|nr:unnamed protein product [Macrosiphum euphorbiae]
MEGFESIKNVYGENVQLSLGENRGQFNALFDYYRSTWLQGVNSDMLSVNDTVWRTNNVLEVSHQHLRAHMGNRQQPEPWIFLKGLITYSRVNVPQLQPLIERVNAPRPPSPILLELPPHPHREEIIARLLPLRIRQPVPENFLDVSSNSDDEDNVIARTQANQILNEDFNSNYL